MIHFGIVSPPVSGHIHPFAALGRELQSRGHRVTYFQVVDLEQKIGSEDIGFWAVGQSDHPKGSLPESLARLGQLKGTSALRFTIRAIERTTVMMCRDLPDAVKSAGVEALLVDQMEPVGGAVAERLRLPFITVCNALAINTELQVPPPFTPWQYSSASWTRWRNKLGYAVSARLTKPVAAVVAKYRAEWKLPAHRTMDESFSPLAQICQMPREFDFPRAELPETFHYVGPLRRDPPRPPAFPWERLDGRPLVYASLGTLQNSRAPVFRSFAEACRGLNVQLVLSHGGGLTKADEETLPGAPLVVSYAPQFELLARASATITHAGLNTVLDSLTNGVPVVTVPITYEQPAIARRVERAGAGQSISMGRLTPARLRNALQAVLEQPRYREAAQKIAAGTRTAGGVARAAEIIESALD
ncbi:MAG TPA: glycosyltransferase [Vicinamibacterales bacterium]|nr:glycosyltransferase [Vicinamibacterales bacterium]